MLGALGLTGLDDVAARCTRLRADLGLPAGLWTADRLADVLAAAVLDAGWPAVAAVPALLAVAADPTTRSPARLSCPGPWWDTPMRPPGGDSTSAGQDGEDGAPVGDLEAVLAETGGLRVALQRQARAELSGEGVPLTRSSVTRRAVDIMRRGGLSGAPTLVDAAVRQAVPAFVDDGIRAEVVRPLVAGATRVRCGSFEQELGDVGTANGQKHLS